jgi:hypothetical protein
MPKNLHKNHDIQYWMEGITTSQTAILLPSGDVEVTGSVEIERFDGDVFVYCKTCSKRLVAGEEGLSEDWQAV